MNRWRRYQLARLDGLISGLLSEARRLADDDLESEIIRLGNDMRDRLGEHCDALRHQVHADVALGRRPAIPDLSFERF
jgi:hypothetical protein